LISAPTAECLIENIQDDTWILSDAEFPVTQCAEETTSTYGNLFPREHLLKVVTTEYGEKIDLYNSRYIETIFEKVKRSGTGLTIEDPIFLFIYTIINNSPL